VEAVVYKCTNDSVAKVVRGLFEKGLDLDSIMKLANKSSRLNLSFDKGKFEKGDNVYVDAVEKKVGISDNLKMNNSVVIVVIKEILPPQTKKLKEARGLITADYQNYLEKEWIKRLHAEHKVIVNEEVLKSLATDTKEKE
jgi:peptidyl-prolyl cis-trans isomerase SurA